MTVDLNDVCAVIDREGAEAACRRWGKTMEKDGCEHLLFGELWNSCQTAAQFVEIWAETTGRSLTTREASNKVQYMKRHQGIPLKRMPRGHASYKSPMYHASLESLRQRATAAAEAGAV